MEPQQHLSISSPSPLSRPAHFLPPQAITAAVRATPSCNRGMKMLAVSAGQADGLLPPIPVFRTSMTASTGTTAAAAAAANASPATPVKAGPASSGDAPRQSPGAITSSVGRFGGGSVAPATSGEAHGCAAACGAGGRGWGRGGKWGWRGHGRLRRQRMRRAALLRAARARAGGAEGRGGMRMERAWSWSCQGAKNAQSCAAACGAGKGGTGGCA
eukprot:364331-Chlamydomonas_euryale.AAC.9